MTKTVKAKPRRAKFTQAMQERGGTLNQHLDAMKLLVSHPHRPVDMVDKLGTSRRTVERLLRAFPAVDLKLEVEHVGRDAFYSLSKESLIKRLGLE